MITLIAESKTMSASRPEIFNPQVLTQPIFAMEAFALAHSFASLSVEEIAERMMVSMPLAIKTKKLFFDFQISDDIKSALTEYTGEVFRAFDAPSLPQDAVDFTSSRLFIISSLYGLLRATDLTKPYRFDFDIEFPGSGKTVQKDWKQKITIAFVKMLKDRGEREVLDLLPGEAAKCLDWKIIKRFARVMKVNFKTVDDKGQLKTPYSGKIKELRGKFLREIVTSHIDRLDEVLTIHTPLLALDEDSSLKDYPTFISI